MKVVVMKMSGGAQAAGPGGRSLYHARFATMLRDVCREEVGDQGASAALSRCLEEACAAPP
jgi:hypothetical protein